MNVCDICGRIHGHSISKSQPVEVMYDEIQYQHIHGHKGIQAALPAAAFIDTYADFEKSGTMYLHEPQFGLIIDVRYTRIRGGCLFGATWPRRSSSHARSVGEISIGSSPIVVVTSVVTPGYTRGGAITRRWAMMSTPFG